MDLFLILYEVLEEEKGKCSFSVAQQYPDDPFQIEGENRIHVWFTVIFFSLWRSVMHKNEGRRRLEVIILRTTIDAKL